MAADATDEELAASWEASVGDGQSAADDAWDATKEKADDAGDAVRDRVDDLTDRDSGAMDDLDRPTPEWDDTRDDVASADNNRGLDDEGNPTGEDPRFA